MSPAEQCEISREHGTPAPALGRGAQIPFWAPAARRFTSRSLVVPSLHRECLVELAADSQVAALLAALSLQALAALQAAGRFRCPQCDSPSGSKVLQCWASPNLLLPRCNWAPPGPSLRVSSASRRSLRRFQGQGRPSRRARAARRRPQALRQRPSPSRASTMSTDSASRSWRKRRSSPSAWQPPTAKPWPPSSRTRASALLHATSPLPRHAFRSSVSFFFHLRIFVGVSTIE